MKKIIFILCALLTLTPLLSCKTKTLPVKDVKIIRQDGNEFIVKAEIAEKTEDRNHGYMERKNIPDGTGMLFVFEKDQILSFWMKNTPHPLSIAYIDSNGIIRDIFDMQPFSLETIASTTKARYALEVPQGWFAKEGIEVGDSLKITDKIK